MRVDVRFSVAAEDDLDRLFDFLLERAETVEDFDLAQSAIEAIRSAVMNQLAATPYSFRRDANSSFPSAPLAT